MPAGGDWAAVVEPEWLASLLDDPDTMWVAMGDTDAEAAGRRATAEDQLSRTLRAEQLMGALEAQMAQQQAVVMLAGQGGGGGGAAGDALNFCQVGPHQGALLAAGGAGGGGMAGAVQPVLQLQPGQAMAPMPLLALQHNPYGAQAVASQLHGGFDGSGMISLQQLSHPGAAGGMGAQLATLHPSALGEQGGMMLGTQLVGGGGAGGGAAGYPGGMQLRILPDLMR
jgi:hypothetical protein